MKRALPSARALSREACKALVAKRLKRSGMRWRKACGSAAQIIRALIKPGLFDRSWGAFMGARCGPANDNISASEDLETAA